MRAVLFGSALVLIMASASLAAPIAPVPTLLDWTPVHGCHQNYGHDTRGLHRHDKHCRSLRELVGRKNRAEAKT